MIVHMVNYYYILNPCLNNRRAWGWFEIINFVG